MNLFKINQLYIQIFINFFCLLAFIYFYFRTLQHKPVTFEVKTLIKGHAFRLW